MRKPLAIFILVFLLFQLAGYLVVFQIRGFQIRWEIERRIHSGAADEDLVQIRVPLDNRPGAHPKFRFINRHEIQYGDMRYDIVRREKEADAVLLYCLADEEETRLFSQVLETYEADPINHARKQKHRDLLRRFLESFFCLASFEGAGQDVTDPPASVACFQFGLKTWEIPPPTPPPRPPASPFIA